MKLPSPQEIELDGVSTQLFADAQQLAHQVNELRPVSSEVMERIEQELLGDRVYNSNAIDGNQLTLRETVRVLQGVQSMDVGRRRDVTEATNLGKVIANLQTVVSDPSSWDDRDFFLKQHRVLLTCANDEHAGMFRNQSVMIRGAMYQPPSETRVDALMDDVFRCVLESTEVEPIRFATWIHRAIARIHPFFDGNGRMARLWQDLILFGHGYTRP